MRNGKASLFLQNNPVCLNRTFEIVALAVNTNMSEKESLRGPVDRGELKKIVLKCGEMRKFKKYDRNTHFSTFYHVWGNLLIKMR